MKRTPITSSNVAEVGYDSPTKTLEIVFKNGSVYQYHDVPADTYSHLMNAPSLGKYLAAHIKNHFSFTKLEPKLEAVSQEHPKVLRAIGHQPEGDGQEHGVIMDAIMGRG
jgi:hypothetical protein